MTDDCRYVDASTNALGGTTHIDLHGGSLLVAAANANINLNGCTLAFGSAGYNGSVGALTLSRDSIIDLGTSSNGVFIRFTSINWNDPGALLSIPIYAAFFSARTFCLRTILGWGSSFLLSGMGAPSS
jgi:hypothetical protein